MELKFYLNKILKADNIENYTLETIHALMKTYDNFLEKSEGMDPDFPMINFGGEGGKGKKIVSGKNNIYNQQREGESIEETKQRLSTGLDNLESNGSLSLTK